MRVIIHSVFAPLVGGLEGIMQMLAEEVHAAGHEVTVVAPNPDPEGKCHFPFRVVRRPSFGQQLALARRCDLFVMGGLSLKAFAAPLMVGTPIAVSHQFCYAHERRPMTTSARVKFAAARLARLNICCSHYVADHLGAGVKTLTIPNCYDSNLFHTNDTPPRERDIAFVGRLVSDKGADLLVEAMAALARGEGGEPLRTTATIMGAGPEADRLRDQARDCGVLDQITFTGSLPAAAVADQLRRHRVMVAPARWKEPFGIVALEGIACGCVVVASGGGGLSEAVGPAGLTFPNNDAGAFAVQLRRALTEPGLMDQLRAQAPAHLAQHTRQAVGRRYVEAFEQAIGKKGRPGS